MKKRIILILLLFILAGFFYFIYALTNPCQKTSFPQRITIKKGETVNQISDKLKNKNIICDSFVFETYLWLSGKEGRIKAGEYFFEKPLNIKNLTFILLKGQRKKEKTIKIIEGWNIRDIANLLEKKGFCDKKDFLSYVSDKKEILKLKLKYPFLKDMKEGTSLEGYLFPDTYRVYEDADIEDIVEKMLNNFGKKVDDNLRNEIKKQNKTVFEIVTMASIIEKEVRNEEDMKIVSGIFWNRIKNGQALQSCATLAYILGKNKRQYSYEDIKVVSPYNTYLNKGLPVGPIANPGLTAIKAAIFPEKTDFNYFLSKENGETVFSKTLKEHELNKLKYINNK